MFKEAEGYVLTGSIFFPTIKTAIQPLNMLIDTPYKQNERKNQPDFKGKESLSN